MTEFFHRLTATWWGITLIVLAGVALLTLFSAVFYRQFFKRFYDILLSFVAIVILSPVMLILIIAGAIAMGGNPFFTQKRPGKKRRNGEEKIFRLIKFRTMSNKRDENGNLLPDEKRLNKYGRILRSTSLDELPELFNIFIGDMSVVGRWNICRDTAKSSAAAIACARGSRGTRRQTAETRFPGKSVSSWTCIMWITCRFFSI